MKRKKGLFVQTIIMLALVAFIILAIIFLLEKYIPQLLPVLKNGSEAEIESFIRSGGTLMSTGITALLQFFQVLSIVFPGAPIQVAAGIIFGFLKSYFICHISYIAANVTVFFFARKLSGRAAALVKYANRKVKLKFITESEYPEFMIMLACLMPFLPNGIIPYVAARTKVSFKRFIIAVSAGSFPTIFMFCAIGNRILKGNYVFAAVLFGSMMLIIVLVFIFRDKIIEWVKTVVSTFKKRRG